MLDLTRSREVKIDILGNNEEIFTFVGVVSMKMIDEIAKLQNNIDFKVNDKGIQMTSRDILSIKAKMEKKAIETFFGDKYEEYQQFCKRNEETTHLINNFVYGKIEENIQDLQKDKKEDDEGLD